MNEQQIWQFYYHRGSAGLYGHVRASTERAAMLVATAWCEQQGPRCRPPASVTPFILAEESILIDGEKPEIKEEPLPGVVEATTAVSEPKGATIGERIRASFK